MGHGIRAFERELKRRLELEGASVVSVTRNTHKRHLCLTVRTPGALELRVPASSTPSSFGDAANHVVQTYRRLAREAAKA